MSFTLKEIKGAVVDINVLQYTHYERGEQCFTPKELTRLHNDLRQQSSVRLRFNREKLARLIRDVERSDGWLPDVMADAIMMADKEIVEVCND